MNTAILHIRKISYNFQCTSHTSSRWHEQSLCWQYGTNWAWVF